MRYVFHPRPEKPGYVIVFDTALSEPVAELVDAHAQMVYLMYTNVSKQLGPVAGDEFMYGHVLGVTLTLINASRYSKIEIKEMDGNRMVVIRDPVTGDTSLTNVNSPNETNMANSLIGRVKGDNIDGRA